MARTDKDLPYWVMTRTPPKGVRVWVHHDHTIFGREFRRRRLKRDENGIPVVSRTEFPVAWNEWGKPIKWGVSESLVRETYVVGVYADECVIDYGTPLRQRGVFDGSTCSVWLDDWRIGKRKRPHARGKSHSRYREVRPRERDFGLRIVKAHRGEGACDFDGFEVGEERVPTKLPRPWWD